MLMVVDVGNTNITVGFYENEILKNTFRMTTHHNRTSDELGRKLTDFMQLSNYSVDELEDVIISSVVPNIMHSFTNAVRRYLKKVPMIVSHELNCGIQVQTDNPLAVGADRIVDLAGCYHKYGGNAIVIDFGTATTFDYISQDGVFKYGVMTPGIAISANALFEKCAKLPEVEIQKPHSILATNTISSMQAGLVYGYIGQCEYIIAEMKKALQLEACQVIATGGLGRLIASNTQTIDIYDPDLTFTGLRYIYLLNKE